MGGMRRYNRNYDQRMWRVVRSRVGRPAVAVEIGTFLGHWVRGLLDHVGAGKVYCVDSLQKGGLREWMRRMDKDAFERAMFLRGSSVGWASLLPEIVVDLLYVDGNHSYRHVIQDLQLWVPKVRRGGLVMAHDAEGAGVRRACEEYFGEGAGQYEPLGPVGKPRILTFWTVKGG